MAASVALLACLPDDSRRCGDVVCPSAQVCTPLGDECVDPDQLEPCAGAADGTACDLDGLGAGTCSGGVCRFTGCGDGNPDPNEQCDDGNTVDNDACTNRCRLPTCGDAIVQPGEGCDNGAANGDDRACTTTCGLAACGDGLVLAGVEGCDLGVANSDSGACTMACAPNRCGDGKTWLGVEGCDDGNGVDDDACRNTCALATCGDDVVQAGEACDDGVANGDDRACTRSCQTATCGDGLVLAGVEGCDLGVANSDGGACTLACAPSRCGDGKTWLGVEGCDDGNLVDDDACRNTCALPTCGDDVVQAGEACDDGIGNGDDRACTLACERAVCGDGRILAGVETCDLGIGNSDGGACTLACTPNVCGDGKTWFGVEGCDAGSANTDTGACTSACTVAACGDGLVWASVESCDDGNAASGDGCRGDCRKTEACGDGAVDAGESCDDGAAGLLNPADGCDACVATAWRTEAVLGREVAATATGLANPSGSAVDRFGNLFIVERGAHRVRRVDAITGAITTVAGNGAPGYAGDGGAATDARLHFPAGVAVDGVGNLYIADTANHRIRRIAAGTGIITTLAGTGVSGDAGDGGPANSAQLAGPWSVATEGRGDVFVADTGSHRIRRIDARTGRISTVAGDGQQGYAGDGGPATSAQLSDPLGVAIGPDGDIYVADTTNHRVRRVHAGTGIITTVAGTGQDGFSGDGGAAASARLEKPYTVALDRAGNLFVATPEHQRIRRVDAVSGVIVTVAGSGTYGFGGDGGPATAAHLAGPLGATLDSAGNLFVADADNNRVRRVAAITGIIATVAGTGAGGESADGGGATSAVLERPHGVAVDAAGNVYIADARGFRIRRVDAITGVITTLAGTGLQGTSGDGGPATAAEFLGIRGVAVDALDNVFVADRGGHRIRRIDATSHIITTVAGTGVRGDGGDGGPAVDANLADPYGVAVDAGGNVYVADTGNQRIRRIDAATGLITTVAGDGNAAYAGDGGLATTASMWAPMGVAFDPSGRLYIADTSNSVIRRVDLATGLISTVAGSFTPDCGGYAGEGGLATNALLACPRGVAIDAAGNLYIADTLNGAIRRVAASTGIITTVAGAGVSGFGGDGGSAVGASFSRTYGVTVDHQGRLYIADTQNRLVRELDLGSGVITTVAGKIDPDRMGPASQAALATPQAMVRTSSDLLVAGGASGTVQAFRVAQGQVEVVAGRYPSAPAGNLARFRGAAFGDVGGVAYDAALGRVYVSETTAHRLHAVTIVDVADKNTWTLAALAGDAAAPSGTAGHADGPPLAARFDSPAGLFFDAAARILFVADTGNHVVRAIPIDGGGVAGPVTTIVGTPRTFGFFGDGGSATNALLFAPRALTRCGNGDLFVADTSNHRVRRIAAVSGIITTVLGDGVAASAGQGSPAAAFPVDTPLGLACDDFGNVFVTSRTVVRLLVADVAGVVDGDGPVQTLYGAPPRNTYPATVTTCLSGLVVIDADTVQFADACTGVLAEASRQPAP